MHTPTLSTTDKLQLGTPLLHPLDVSHLVALCATADALIERVARLKLHAKTFDVSLLTQIEATCKELVPHKHPQVQSLAGWITHWHAGCGTHARMPACKHTANERTSTDRDSLATHLSPPFARAAANTQATLQELGLLELFPYLAQGLVLGKLTPLETNPSEFLLGVALHTSTDS